MFEAGPHVAKIIPTSLETTVSKIIEAADVLRSRVKDARLVPLPHEAQCLKPKPELAGFFGSYLTGTLIDGSDIDYAVSMPSDFPQDPGKYLKVVLDKFYYAIKAPYGYVVMGEVKGVPIDLYFIAPGYRFDAFIADEALACSLTDEDRAKIVEVKKTAREVGAYGEFGGVPSVAISWAVLYAR